MASIVAIKTQCPQARRIAETWQTGAADGSPPDTIEGYDCVARHHSFDQTIVECDHRGPKEGVAFVYREP